MNFKEGLNYIYKNHKEEFELTNPFVLYSRLSDLCSSSYEAKQKVQMFHQINQKINVIDLVLHDGENIQSRYLEVSDLLSQESFNRLIITIKNALNFDCEPLAVPKNSQPKVVKVVVEKAEESQEVETVTPLISTTNYSGTKKGSIIVFSILGFVLLAIGLLITFACVYNWGWTFWQFLIGIVGGLLLFGISIFIIIWCDDEILVDYYIIGAILLGFFVILNFVLFMVFRESYKIIFSCLSVLEIIGGLSLIFPTFDDLETEWGLVQTVATTVAVVLFIVGITCL